MKVLTQAVDTLFTALTGGAHNNFYNSINGRLYILVPQGTKKPYAAMKCVSGKPDYWMGDEQFEEKILSFTIVSDESSSEEIEDIYNYLIALFDHCSLTVTGYTPVNFERENDIGPLPDLETMQWTYIVDYTVLLQKS